MNVYWGDMGRVDVSHARQAQPSSLHNFLWWRAEEGWGRYLSEIVLSLLPLHHPPNFSVSPFSARCIRSMIKSPVSKSSKRHSGVLKNELFHKQQNFWHFEPESSIWLLLFFSDHSNLSFSLSSVVWYLLLVTKQEFNTFEPFPFLSQCHETGEKV